MFQNSLASSELKVEAALATGPLGKVGVKRLAGLFSTLVSLALLGIVAWHMDHLAAPQLLAMIPRSPMFWAAYAAFYLVPTLIEWAIYRHLWGLPLAGIGALLRKLVSNELLFGYLGEVQFYAWARARLKMVATPFGAIKDVTILSALTGNLVTLVMLAFAWPLVSSEDIGVETRTLLLSLAVVLVTSFAILLFRHKLFSLPRRELWLIAGMHLLRIVVAVGLAALTWHLVLPDVGYGMWLVLATLRMLVMRLPLASNKDVIFAGLAVFLLGHEAQIGALMAMMAGLLLVTHLFVGAIFATADLLTARDAK